MNFDGMDWILITLVFPTIILIFKQELLSFLFDLRLYKNRLIDADGDPATGEDCYVQTGRSSGSFHKVTVAAYKFGLSSSKRKVVTLQEDSESGEILKVSCPYKEWSQIVKGTVPK